MDLPEITEVKRLRLEPGDALVVRTEGQVISQEAAEIVRGRVRAVLRLPDDFPVLVMSAATDIEVVTRGRS